MRVQDAAAIFRRSQVQVELDPEERRIFEAVVRPERVKADGNAQIEIDRLSKEVERSRQMLGNERFVANAAPEVVDAEREKLDRYERELQALEACPRRFGFSGVGNTGLREVEATEQGAATSRTCAAAVGSAAAESRSEASAAAPDCSCSSSSSC